MGTTLYTALLTPDGENIRQVWLDLLQRKVPLSILLQGNYIGHPRLNYDLVSMVKGEPSDEISAHSKAVSGVFSSLIKKYDKLEIRLAQRIITHSAFIAYTKGFKVDIQVHPYAGHPKTGLWTTFSATTQTAYHSAVAGPIGLMWTKALKYDA